MGHARRPAILRPSHTIAVAVLCTLAGACSGTSSEPHTTAAQGVDVQVVPSTATVAPNATTRLAATVTGTANTAVTWSVVQTSGGTVDATGMYTAPGTAGSYTVRATSVADSTAHGDAAVTVTAPPPPPVTVTISPRTPSVTAGGTITFTATVANATNTAVTWSVTGTSCGSITSAGVYTAPAAAGTCSVAAKSVQDPTRSDTTTVTVTAPPPPISVSLSPSPAATNSCLTLTFTATVANATNKAVTWSVQEGATGGTITTAGVYTAPANAGTYHVVATSVADGTKTAVSTVTVTDKILSVTTSPATVSLTPGGTQQFTATVTTTCGSFQAVASVP